MSTDSREYRFAFEIQSLSEIPADFAIPQSPGTFQSGVFLPRDDPDWFGRRSYPARVLLLDEQFLTIAAHPSACEQITTIRLRDLDVVESGHVLLIGWLRLFWTGRDRRIAYNTRTKCPVDNFLKELQRAWFAGEQHPHAEPARSFGPNLDVKFNNAMRFELGKREAPAINFFQPPIEHRKNYLLLSRVRTTPGNFVAVAGARLVWITDSFDRTYERYGVIARSAKLSSVKPAYLQNGDADSELTVRFRSGLKWSLPIAQELRDECRAFSERLREFRALVEAQTSL
jgi:hypothetical protein